MTKKAIMVVALIFMYVFSRAADTIIVHKDPRLDVFVAKQATINKLTSKRTPTGQFKGYRIQVINTRNRNDAFKLKTELMQKFPLQQTYLLYQSPYFKVRIGNFFRKADAVSFKNQLSRMYTENVYVVDDIIEYNPREDEEFNF